MGTLTERQQEVLAAIVTFRNEHGVSPTHREICTIMGFASPNAARGVINALVKKGALRFDVNKSRSLVPIANVQLPEAPAPAAKPASKPKALPIEPLARLLLAAKRVVRDKRGITVLAKAVEAAAACLREIVD